jgi:hypothetical protein
MGMSGVSKSQVSRLCEEIDERVNAFLQRPVEGEWPYIWIDAAYSNASGHAFQYEAGRGFRFDPGHPACFYRSF